MPRATFFLIAAFIIVSQFGFITLFNGGPVRGAFVIVNAVVIAFFLCFHSATAVVEGKSRRTQENFAGI